MSDNTTLPPAGPRSSQMTAENRFIETVQQAVAAGGNKGVPLYRRLQRGIRHAIEAGAIHQDDALPAERDLALHLGVSRITVRRAVQELAAEGLLSQRQGAGTFVTPRVEQPLSQLTGYTEDMTARGMRPSVQWLNRAVATASPDEALALNLSPGSEVTSSPDGAFDAPCSACERNCSIPGRPICWACNPTVPVFISNAAPFWRTALRSNLCAPGIGAIPMILWRSYCCDDR